jgi:conjugative relaxase-like TrwC/TraI family protein
MLRVTTLHASTAGPTARYYTHYLADEGPEGEGQWRGRQAAQLGLVGSVSTDDLETLLSGHDPVTGTRLGNPLVDRWDAKGNLIPAVAGFDATFSAPKSLSVWWGLTGDPGVLEAHDLAVQAVLDHLERYGATTRVRVSGSRQHPEVGGLVMAAFRQATSREDDPQIHSHVVISTKVQTADGRWLALDARYLKRKQRALGGLYQSVLRAELTHRYGVAWQPIVKGQAEIEGMPEELIKAFSKRTEQVKAELEAKVSEFREREGRDPTKWERAALTREAAQDSRANKTHASTADLDGGWSDEAAALGWTPERLTAAMRTAPLDVPSKDTIDIADVLEHLSTTGSTWTRADVLRAVCDLAPPVSQLSGRGWAQAVEGVVDRMIATCVDLDPPVPNVVTRGSDGRSIWLAPSEPHLTHERVLAEEERIITFAMGAHDQPPKPSNTVEREGLDPLQADAATAVAGYDRLVLVVGPAGTGKTTTLRRAVEDLQQHRRRVFGVAPTAKAAKVLRGETGTPSDTVAKLLYEWRSGQPDDEYRLPSGTTVICDEAGMLGTGALDQLAQLTVSQRWRLVLVGDPSQLQAVGRGGMFDELCRTGRTHELATIHRFRHRWEQEASLLLRAGNTAALDAYVTHGRVLATGFADLVDEAARQWVDQTDRGRTVALVAETNEHVDALNEAVQGLRRERGQLAEQRTPVAGGETASTGDVVVTRRNDRSIRTDLGEPIRNRDRWTVLAVAPDGALTVSHDNGHGTATLNADYVREHVRLGYAATAHGHQGDTVDIGLALVNEATSHRSVYVGATRGRLENRLLVVADDASAARDVLERVLINERADVPAVVQRRNLAEQVPRARLDQDPVRTARQAAEEIRREVEPFLEPLRVAEAKAETAEAALRREQAALSDAPRWRRRGLAETVQDASEVLAEAQTQLADAEQDASPYLARIDAAEDELCQAELQAHRARINERFDQIATGRGRTPDRGVGIGL